MAEKLDPKNEKPLIPLYNFLSGARVTNDDVEIACDKWKEDQNEKEFQNILEASSE